MKSREITLQPLIDEIISKCIFCSVAMTDKNGEPYLIPMNFGYESGIIYLHSAPEGKKVDLLKSNSRVCINFSSDLELRHQHPEVACSYSMKYRSVLAWGNVEFIYDHTEKRRILDLIMKQYTNRSGFRYNDPAVKNVLIYKIVADRMTCRVYGY